MQEAETSLWPSGDGAGTRPDGISAPVPEAAVRAQLRRVLTSAKFTRSVRRREFLTYIVEHSLSGQIDALRGDEIAVAVFARGDDFDPQADPVVRIEARRLRHDLDRYYEEEGLRDPVLISVPKGGYRAVFTSREVEDDDVAYPSAEPTLGQPGRNVWRFPQRGRVLAAALTAMVFGGIGIATGLRDQGAAVPSGAPGLAVAAFEALSAAPEDAYFARGLSDQVAHDLQPFSNVRVFKLPGHLSADDATDVQALEATRDITYLLTGTYRGLPDGSAGRLVAQLRRTEGDVVWSRAYDVSRSAADFIALQDELAGDIATKLGQTYGIVAGDLRRQAGETLPTNESFACLLKAYEYQRTLSAGLRNEVVACIEPATVRDPGNAEVWAMAGYMRRDLALMRNIDAAERQVLLASAMDATTRAIALGPENTLALRAHAALLHSTGDYDAAETVMRRALALNPHDPETLQNLGWRVMVRGRLEEGAGYIRQSIERSIDPPPRYYNLLAIDDLMAGRFDDMLVSAEITASGGSAVGLALVAIAETRAPSGSPDAARAALRKLAESSSPMATTPGEYMRRHGVRDEIADEIVEGLIEAGWSADG
ncbi:tetratricopeptide repeat protein [Halovulum sp. GXIMD14794]